MTADISVTAHVVTQLPMMPTSCEGTAPVAVPVVHR